MDSSGDGASTLNKAPEFQIDVEERDGETVVTAVLRCDVDECYRLFTDVDLIPQWLWVVDTSVVQERDEKNRATRVDFIGSLERAAIGYTLTYDYDDEQREVRWLQTGRGMKQLAGAARFEAVGDGRCRLEYSLRTELTAGLPPWADQLYHQRPAETVVLDFCEFVERGPTD